MPEKQPLIVTISSELLLLIFFVQLFSNPQHTQAPRASSDPLLNTNASFPSKLRRMLAAVSRAIASHSLLETTYRKRSSAMTEVATISKLLSRDTFAEFVPAIPNIRRTGAAISSTTIAIV